MKRKMQQVLQKLCQWWHNIWNWYKGLYKGQPWWKKTLAGIGTFIVFILFYCFAVVNNLFWLFGSSPSLNEIIHPRNNEASEIYSADGKLIGKYFSENRTPVPYDSIAPCFIEALVSTEDERFYQHHGIDIIGLGAALKDATQGHARGASTITQQLVKNMHKMRSRSQGLLGHIPGVKMLIMKSKEMIIATEIELFCSKEDILRMYSNTVDFGCNAYGIKVAAKTYFGTTPAKLKPEEAAVLVGLLKATSQYNPKINPKNALARRNVVLDNMFSHGHLTMAERDSLQALPIDLKFKMEDALDGVAHYFRHAVADEIKELAPEIGEDLYTGGFKIYTTLDTRMQQYAEEAVHEKIKVVQQNFRAQWAGNEPWTDEHNQPIPGYLEAKIKGTDTYKMLAARYANAPDSIEHYLNRPHLVHLYDYDGGHDEIMSSMDSLRYILKYIHAGFIAIEPQTGDVKAYVGNIDYRTWKYDNVQAHHQPGSTFKLFVYAEAMRQGKTPSYRVLDDYIRMEVTDPVTHEPSIWQPHNSDGRFTGQMMPLRAAFARSTNTVAVRLGQEVGIPNVITIAQEMGITSKLENAPSLPLGASDVSVQELVSAYTTIANGGVHVRSHMVQRIVDRDGKEVYTYKKEEKRVLDEISNFFVQKLLYASAHDGGGTSMSFCGYVGNLEGKLDFGGKTGTSNNHADSWFVGVTPKLVAGVWVGGEYRQIHFRTGAVGQGSRAALPTVGYFFNKVMTDPHYSNLICRYPSLDRKVDTNLYDGTFIDTSRVDTTANDTLAIINDEEEKPQGEENGGNSNAEPSLVPNLLE